MKRNRSLANIGGTIAVLAIAAFASASAQTTTSTFKKGSPEAAREISAKAQSSLTVNNSETGSRDKGDRVSKRLEQLQQRLNLTADQLTKIQTIIQNSREKAKAAREQAGMDKEAFKKAMQENMRNTDAQIQAQLNADQRTKYAELKAEMKAKRENGEDRDGRREKDND